MELGPCFQPTFQRLASASLGSSRLLSLGEIADRLPAEQIIDLAQLAVIGLEEPEQERLAGKAALESLSNHQAVDQSPLSPVWAHIQNFLHRPLQTPVLTTDPDIDLGASSGDQVVINQANFDHPDDSWIVMSHEAAHSELQHSRRHEALEWLGRDPNFRSADFISALTKGRQELELEADFRGITIVGQKLEEPEKLLESFLLMREGPNHPEGLLRAENARQALQSVGRTISAETWQELLDKTEPTRQKFAAKALADTKFRANLSKFV